MSPTTIPGNLILQPPTANDPLLDLNTQPSLDLQFATSKTLDDAVSGTNLITFSRASSGTYVDSDGLIKTSPVNLLTYSDYSQVAGTTDAQLEGVVAAPDGTITARRYSVPSAGLDTINKITSAGTAGKDYTFSVWVRSTGTASEVRLTVGDPDVITDVQISTQWQRFEITKINNASNFVRSYVKLLNVGDEVEVFGAQLEEGTTVSDYIPTGATISGAPRFDHDPVTGESLGLLIEESRTNLVLNSDTPNLAASGSSPPSVSTVSNQVLPSGEIGSVIFVVYGSGDSRARLFVSGSFTGNYWGSIYWKLKDGGTWTRIGGVVGNGGNFLYADFFPSVLGIPEGSEVYFAFGQVELGSFPTSYIPTSGSTVTRAADVASIEGANFSSWYNQSAGTVFSNATAATTAAIAGFDDGTANERWRIGHAGSNNAAIVVVDNGIVQTNFNSLSNSTPFNQFHKIAGAIATNNLSFAVNSILFSDNTLSVPTVNSLNLGRAIGISGYLNGHIARLTYYPYRLPDTILQEITS